MQQRAYDVLVRPGDRILVPGDIHFGSADLAAVALMTSVAEGCGVTAVVLQGDTFDCGGLSKHRKPAKRQTDGSTTVTYEVAEAREPMAALLRACGGNGYIMKGNHEDRVARLVDDEMPALVGLQWSELYQAALTGWEVVPDEAFVRAGRVSIFHGHTLTGMRMGGGVTPAKTVLGHYPGQNTVFGHTHRRDQYSRPTWKDGAKVEHGAWNVGHLSDEAEAGWSGHNAWERSFALISFFEGGRFSVDLAQFAGAGAGVRCYVLGEEWRL